METNSYKLIAFDLDGTLLDDGKHVPEENLRALREAGEAGIWLVPATGRIPAGLPEPLRGLPGLRWGILVNGALLYDFAEERVVGREEIPLPLALELIDYMAAYPVLYDCYQDEWGYIDRRFFDSAEAYIADPGIIDLLHRVRTPVPSLRQYLADKGKSVQKLQLHTRDEALRQKLLRELPEHFPQLAVTSSIPTNIEINAKLANKGDGLRRLCALLGLHVQETLAFGDGTNDVSMLRAAGCGVAMANAAPAVKAAADALAPSNNEYGVAQFLRLILGKE